MNLIKFELKLFVRNKRLRQLSIVSVLLFPLMIYMQLANSASLKEMFLVKMFFLWTLFVLPANFTTFAFSVNAGFIEKQVIAPLSISKLLQAKFRLFCIVSSILFIIFLPNIFLRVKLMELIAAFLFAVGFGFFGLFWTSLASYKSFDIKASYFINYQGFDVSNYFSPILVVIVALGFIGLFHWLFNETVTLIVMSLTGLVFITTNKIWLGFIARSFEKTRYRRLECFREK